MVFTQKEQISSIYTFMWSCEKWYGNDNELTDAVTVQATSEGQNSDFYSDFMKTWTKWIAEI